MSLLAPKDTLAYQFGARPMFIKRVLSDVPCSNVAVSLKNFMQSATPINPEIEALQFYMLNHAVAEVRARMDMYEPLGKYLPILEAFNKLSYASTRMFYYILIICVRETRHLHNEATMKPKLAAKYGHAAAEFVASIPDDPSVAMQHFYGSPPKCTVGQAVDAMRDAFYQGSWSSGFGGKKWGVVNDAICKFTHGEFSAEMMMDIAFTLAHNGGPIFNKGMLYTHYNSTELLKILDVQRGGMIPQLIASGQIDAKFKTKAVMQDYQLCLDILGDCFAGPVDWAKVQSLGAKGHYTNMPAAGHKKTVKATAFGKTIAKTAKDPNVFHVMPGLDVPIIKRPKAA